MDRLNSNKKETENIGRQNTKNDPICKTDKNKLKKQDQSFSDLVCKKKTLNICIIRFSEEEVGGVENELKEVMNEHFPNIFRLRKLTKSQTE